MKKEKTNENKKQKKEKKHSNKKTVLIVVGCFVVFCVAAMILTGGWNPFKSKEVSKEALENYEKSEEVANNLWLDMFPDLKTADKHGEYYSDMELYFGQNGQFPYGFEILEDNGKEGKDGVLKAMSTANSEYDNTYGFDYTVYYMKNSDYADERYQQLKNGDEGVNEFRKEYSFSNGKITIARSDELDLVLYYIKVGTVVYRMDGRCSTYDVNKIQPLFDKLGIQYTVPNLAELKK